MTSDLLIKIDNVRKTYAGNFEALKGVNLEIKRGEILALLGPNGAGKTTLINAICGVVFALSLINKNEPTRPLDISYAVLWV